jgi:hypothetical protein
MPKLNPDKCYEQQERRLTITVPTPLPENWLATFYTLLSEQLKLNDETRREGFDFKTGRVIRAFLQRIRQARWGAVKLLFKIRNPCVISYVVLYLCTS